MTVSNPNILYFLLAIIVVILIHLLNLQKFKKVYFSNIRLLNEVVNEKRKRSKLENLILIVLRSLIVGCLVLAFSQLIFSKNTKLDDNKSVSIYVDNSLSNSRKIGEPNLLDLQKKYASDLVTALGDNYEYHIISNDFYSGKHARFIDKTTALEKIQSIQLSNYTKSSQFILDKIKQNRDLKGSKSSALQFFMSDFQTNQHQLADFLTDSTQTYLMPFQSVQNQNISIESVKSTSPFYIKGQPISLDVALKNHNSEHFKSLPIKVFTGEKQKTIQSVDLEPLEEKIITLNFILKPEESKNITVKIEDNSFEYDNQFYTSINTKNILKVAHIFSKKPTEAFDKLYRTEAFDYDNIQENNINYQTLPTYQFIILDGLTQWNSGLAQKITEASKNGANIFIIPNNKTINNLNEFLVNIGLKQTGLAIDAQSDSRFTAHLKHPIFKRMFKKGIPDISQLTKSTSYKSLYLNSKEKDIIRANNKPFLSSLELNEGLVYVLYSDLNTGSNFTNHQLFAPLGINMAYLNKNQRNKDVTIGEFQRLYLPNTIKDNDVHILYDNKDIQANINRFKQSKFISIDDQFNRVGFINIFNKKELLSTYGLNQNRKESEMVFLEKSTIEKKTEQVDHLHYLDTKKSKWNTFIQNQKQERYDWMYFLLGALLFYLIEMVFVLFINKNTTHETAH